ncbi:hypothetical protein [Streptomyces goshikiensis]|uniref:hypothetical protein n=1 Tax=Streptomyces goshikiensis TaxID=1942 RepID=UPI0036646FB8
MSEVARSEARSSELEISIIPEVAALATELTTLFKALGIPQQQYAVRVLLDKSTVSRILNGRRVAPQDFIDRLFLELERHLQVKVTDETKLQIRSMRMAALKKTNPGSYQLESLREELDRAHRAIKQLKRQQEALELLLDQRESAADEARREMAQLRADWIAEQQNSQNQNAELANRDERLQDEQQKLSEEIENLKRQLIQVTDFKRSAEQESARLAERLLEVERELAHRLEEIGDQSFTLTPEEAVAEILASYNEQRFHDAARTLSLSAAHFSAAEVVQLWFLIMERRRQLDAETLIRDALRFRSAEFCADIIESLLEQPSWSSHYDQTKNLSLSLSNSKSAIELDFLYERWKSGGPLYGILRHTLVSWAESAPPHLVAHRLQALKADRDTAILVRMLNAFGRRNMTDVVLLSEALLHVEMTDEYRTLFTRWRSAIPADSLGETEAAWRRMVKERNNEPFPT